MVADTAASQPAKQKVGVWAIVSGEGSGFPMGLNRCSRTVWSSSLLPPCLTSWELRRQLPLKHTDRFLSVPCAASSCSLFLVAVGSPCLCWMHQLWEETAGPSSAFYDE